jgi:hypothetical protein
MAKKRTKLDKKQASNRRQYLYSLPKDAISQVKKSHPKKITGGQDITHIKKDLGKTVLLSLVIIGLELVIYTYTR